MIEKHNRALFDVVDRNHDGNITWEEYKSVMETRGLMSLPPGLHLIFSIRTRMARLIVRSWQWLM